MGNTDPMGAIEDLRAIEQELDDKCIENEKLRKEIGLLNARFQAGRSYLMQVESKSITVPDALESFGFGRNGLK